MKKEMLENINKVIQEGPYSDCYWESFKDYKVPEWYEEGKFGIFIHWGLYSVPAFGNEWYPRNMYLEGTPEFKHHIDTYGPQKEFGYKDFIPMFKAEKFDAQYWAEILKKSGARFVVPVAEHHDGFQMYESSLSKWNAANMGPKADIIGMLSEAVKKQGITFGVSSHRAEHWWFFDGGMKFDSDVRSKKYHDFYGPAEPAPKDWNSLVESPPDTAHLEDWLLRTCELVDKYQPELVWFDWWINQEVFAPYLRKFAAYYYNMACKWGKKAAINYKYNAIPEYAAVFDVERGQLSGIRSRFWQTDTSVSKNSWGYVVNQDYKSANDIICDLVDIVSKNGALLLNIGPRPDGTIPEKEQEILLEIGKWLEINGEAIYGTRPWIKYGEGPTEVKEGAFTDTNRGTFTSEDIRFTTKGDALYAVVLKCPESGYVNIKSINSGTGISVENVELLGSSEKLCWKSTDEGLTFNAPCNQSDYPVTFKINYK